MDLQRYLPNAGKCKRRRFSVEEQMKDLTDTSPRALSFSVISSEGSRLILDVRAQHQNDNEDIAVATGFNI